MYANNVGMRTRCLWVAVGLAGALFAGTVPAKDYNVTVALHVSARGLDLNQPADAQRFYARLKDAAWVVCTRADRVGLEPLDDPEGCAEKSLGEVIRSLNLPTLTQIYLATHTLQQAAVAGINVHLQAAAH